MYVSLSAVSPAWSLLLVVETSSKSAEPTLRRNWGIPFRDEDAPRPLLVACVALEGRGEGDLEAPESRAPAKRENIIHRPSPCV